MIVVYYVNVFHIYLESIKQFSFIISNLMTFITNNNNNENFSFLKNNKSLNSILLTLWTNSKTIFPTFIIQHHRIINFYGHFFTCKTTWEHSHSKYTWVRWTIYVNETLLLLNIQLFQGVLRITRSNVWMTYPLQSSHMAKV